MYIILFNIVPQVQPPLVRRWREINSSCTLCTNTKGELMQAGGFQPETL